MNVYICSSNHFQFPSKRRLGMIVHVDQVKLPIYISSSSQVQFLTATSAVSSGFDNYATGRCSFALSLSRNLALLYIRDLKQMA